MSASFMIDQPRSVHDWTAIRRICSDTGAPGGKPVDPRRRDFFGRFWTDPYRVLLPKWTFVLRSGGQIAGYLTAAPDTVRFEKERYWKVRLPLFFRVCFALEKSTGDTRRFFKRFIGWEIEPERRFPEAFRKRMLLEFPAHLHINLAADARSRGLGAALLEALAVRLRARKISGVHLYCGEGPKAFYLKNGFVVLNQIELSSGISVYAMGLKVR